MFRWAIIFAVIALIASLLGFGGVGRFIQRLCDYFIGDCCDSCDCRIFIPWQSLKYTTLNKEKEGFRSFFFYMCL